jgi:hypothetical protein
MPRLAEQHDIFKKLQRAYTLACNLPDSVPDQSSLDEQQLNNSFTVRADEARNRLAQRNAPSAEIDQVFHDIWGFLYCALPQYNHNKTHVRGPDGGQYWIKTINYLCKYLDNFSQAKFQLVISMDKLDEMADDYIRL